VPAENCGRLHQEQGTGRQLAAQDHAIGHPPARASSSASEDEQLLAEDEEFEIAIGSRAAAEDEEVDQQAEEGVEKGQQHGASRVDAPELPIKRLGVAYPMVSGRLGEVGAIKAAVSLLTRISLPVVVDE